jgi:HlyD family secretion protein
LLLGISAWAYVRRQGEAVDELVTEAVERGGVASTVTASGTVNPVTTVQVGTYVSGPIQAIYADFNSRVTKGQVVAKIDPAPFQVKVASAQAAVATAAARVDKDRADLGLKKLTLERNRHLLERRLISQNDLDTASSNYDQALAQLALDQAAVQQARADLEAARINLGYTDIASPVDGIVVSRNVDVGQTVAASFQTPTLFLIAQDLTKMQVDTSVSEADIGGVAVGQSAAFQVDAYLGKEFPGEVVQVRIAPTTVQNVVTYDVVIGVDNPRLELRPGMTATVTITTARREGVLKIPQRALRFRPRRPAGEPEASSEGGSPGRASAVYVVEPGGRLKRVGVELGVRDDRSAELVSGGLKEGDALAVAYKRLESGSSPQQAPPSFVGGRRGFR